MTYGLSGKRVLVTRPRGQSEGLVERSVELGALPLIFPTIEIAPLADPALLDRAITQLDAYQWVIFTSVNGVSAFWQRLEACGKDQRVFTRIRVAAIGPATARALRDRGVALDFMPEQYVAEAILPGLGNVRGQRILLPRAEIARKALVNELLTSGAFPDEIAVYRTIPAKPEPQALAQLAGGIDIATFTSSSTLNNFFEILGNRAVEVLRGAVIACIGPITADTARSRGLSVDLTASEYTSAGLVEALLAFFNGNPERKSS